MPEDLGEQAVRIFFRAGSITLSLIRSMAQKALDSRNRIEHGEQSLKKLDRQGKQLESVTIVNEDIKKFRRELNRYSVDFSVMRDKKTEQHSIFFKGQDIDRVYAGLEKTLNMAIDRTGGKKPMKEVMEQATKKAAERAAQQPQKPEKNRSADRAER